MRPQFIQQFPLLHTERTVNPSSFSLWRVVGHRLMSRLPSQLLVPAASLIPKFSKKGCFRESASASLLEGSYSNMLSMRSNSWWCSSASDSRYRWKKGKKKRKRKKVEISGNKKKIKKNSNMKYKKHLLHHTGNFSSPLIIKFMPFSLTPLTRNGLQFSLTYFPAEELSSQSRRPR